MSRLSSKYLSDNFVSIDGECSGFGQGRLTRFVRFQGCNLTCPYCDTRNSKRIESLLDSDDITNDFVNQISSIRNVTITGGEPLIHPGVPTLIKLLYKKGVFVVLETNGTIGFTSEIINLIGLPKLSVVMDWKLESTGVVLSPNHIRQRQANLLRLKDYDIIKIPFKSLMDDELRESLAYIKKQLGDFVHKPSVFLSPIQPHSKPVYCLVPDMIDLIREVGPMKIGLNLQLHKLIGVK